MQLATLARTYLQERVLLLILELVRAEKLKTTLGLVALETFGVALKELEDVVDNDGLQIDLFLVIQVLGLQLNLN